MTSHLAFGVRMQNRVATTISHLAFRLKTRNHVLLPARFEPTKNSSEPQ